MADSLTTIGSIATHIYENLNNIPTGVSGNLVEIVDLARQHVENYTGTDIGSNSILDKYQPAIIDFAKADVIDLINAQEDGEKIRLSELWVEETGNNMTAEQYRTMGEMRLRALGKKIRFARSLS